MFNKWPNFLYWFVLIILVIVAMWAVSEKEGEIVMDEMDKILKVTRGVNSHVSIYAFEKTKEGIEEIQAQLPKEFYVEMDMLEEEDGYIAFRADKLAGFEYVEITAYLKKATEGKDISDQY